MDDEALFAAALAKPLPQERQAFLAEACADDSAQLARIEALLHAHEYPDSFLEPPRGAAIPTICESIAEGPGTQIGPYKLLEQIGEGGMGTVWMAEQTDPILRRVAVKVVKEGMDSRLVLARFEAERQALALMEHPNIAKVLDAGRTPSGRPYFVMELVKGQPITKYGDEKRLAVRERLDLFGEVCRAVQHAHQKGIIHRDLKPSNVLVAPYDGKPMVKVIDFGVAKATAQRLTDKTLFTGFGALVGTPEYMSPEQAEVNNQDIDTRSDIYALGVLLYELLTGSTPLTRKRIKEAALLELLRVIREEEPPKPSTRLSESKDSLPAISAQRHTEPAKLTKLVRGELDWIVMKALEKDRNRRYETANAFAMDVQRYLADEPVQACPPSAWYRLRKLVRRNRVALLTAAVVAVALVLGTLVSAWQAVRAFEANRRIRDNLELSLGALDEIYLSVLESRLPRELEAEPEDQELLIKALGFYERFADRNEVDSNVWREVAKAYNRAGILHSRLGHHDQAIIALDRAGEVVARLIVDRPADPELKRLLAEIHLRKGDAYVLQRELVNEGSHQARAAQVEYLKGIDRLEPLIENSALGPKFRDTLASLHNNLGLCLQKDGDLEQGEKHYRQGIKVRTPIVEEEHDLASKLYYMQQLSIGHSNVGVIANMTGRPDEAEKENRQAVELASEVYARAAAVPGYKRGRLPGFPDVHPLPHDLAHAHYHLGNTLRAKGQSQAAEKEYRQAVDFLAQAVEDWPREIYFRGFLAWFRRQYGLLLFEGGKQTESSQQYRQSIEIYRKLQKESGRELANAEQFIESLTLMGDLLFAQGDRDEASKHYRQALDLGEKQAAQNTGFVNDLAWFLVACADPNLRNPARAVGLAQKAVAKSEGKDADHWNTLGVAQYRLGNWKEAIAALENANRLHKERDAADWLFLAMAQWRLGQEPLARVSYNRALELLKVYEYPPAEASRWRAEAAEMLGLTGPKK